ncbi:hypothetical protein ACFYW9_32755 [Streptomyces sp. NPDC002698]|uniref:hypothetical protein n=1 Tax=Streptomyces sp. NPDC002698 TaxID=3364660 RepID=UPI003690D388
MTVSLRPSVSNPLAIPDPNPSRYLPDLRQHAEEPKARQIRPGFDPEADTRTTPLTWHFLERLP